MFPELSGRSDNAPLSLMMYSTFFLPPICQGGALLHSSCLVLPEFSTHSVFRQQIIWLKTRIIWQNQGRYNAIKYQEILIK